jgi:hypothetical protein
VRSTALAGIGPWFNTFVARWRGALTGIVVALAALAVPSVAGAQLDPADTISLSALSGHVYADYPFTFAGSGTVDGADAGDYAVAVLFTPSSSPILRGGCPGDFGATEEAIEQEYGGPDDIAQYSQEGITNPFPLDDGGYTYAAQVNGDVVKTVTAAGSYIACAYLGDDLSGDTYAVSRPVPFTVTDAPGTGTAPTGFGGPRGSHEPRLGLKVMAGHGRIHAPGRNLLKISGSYDATSGPAGLVVTVKSTKRFNGCAANDQQDLQITRADGGAVLTRYEKVAPSSAGNFSSPLAINFKRRFAGTAVLCAYLIDGFGDDLSVGYLRFSADKPKATHKAA